MRESAKKTYESFAVLPGAVGTDGKELGKIRIGEAALTEIATRAAFSAEELKPYSGSGLLDSLADLVSSKQSARAIAIRVCGSEAEADISVKVRFGTNIRLAALEARTRVKEAIETVTGLTVSAVNINVREMEDVPAAEPEKKDTTEN